MPAVEIRTFAVLDRGRGPITLENFDESLVLCTFDRSDLRLAVKIADLLNSLPEYGGHERRSDAALSDMLAKVKAWRDTWRGSIAAEHAGQASKDLIAAFDHFSRQQ